MRMRHVWIRRAARREPLSRRFNDVVVETAGRGRVVYRVVERLRVWRCGAAKTVYDDGTAAFPRALGRLRDRYLHAYGVELHRHPRVLEVLSEILCKLQGQSIGPMIRMGSSDSGFKLAACFPLAGRCGEGTGVG
jgi:hypothetical protein